MATPWKHFDVAQCPAVPWRNGGGTTREIFTLGLPEAFEARVSVATIEKPGPFSAYPGIDRTILLLDGPGVRLSAGDPRLGFDLGAPFAPHSFSGDTAYTCAPIEPREEGAQAPTRVVNIMTRRGACAAEVSVVGHERSGENQPCRGVLLLVVRGEWRVGPAVCPNDLDATGSGTMASGHGAYAEAAAGGCAWHAAPQSPDAVLIAVTFLSHSLS